MEKGKLKEMIWRDERQLAVHETMEGLLRYSPSA